MKPSIIHLVWFLLIGTAHAAVVEYNQQAVNAADGSVIAAVAVNDFQETGKIYSTVTAPAIYQGFRFTHWSNSSEPAASYRDAWGRSRNPVSFVLLEDTTLTAHYLPATLDSDGDGVPDWYELEFFGTLDVAAADDPDGDGFTLLQEYQNGTHPLYANSIQAGGIARATSGMVTFNRAVYPTYILRSEPAGTVNQSAVVPPGTVITTPDLTQNTFGYWTLDGVPQRDAWGVALRQISFTMENANREAVAWFFDGDVDDDGLPDAWEWFHLGTIDHDGSADLNGDGFTLLQLFQIGRSPAFAYAHQAGGVSWADSAMVVVNFADFSRYTLRSVPSGIVDESAIVPDGSVITTPEVTSEDFGYWALDGVPQRDAWGVAWREISFTLEGTDREAVAHFLVGDSDGDGVADAFEMYHFGTLDFGANSDVTGDGVTLLEAYQSGVNPTFAYAQQAGGVAWADSEMVLVNLQPYERLKWMLVDGMLTDFFSPDPGTVTGMQTSGWSATAVSDWDGDGAFDLFVAHEDGLRVFRNIGTPRNPNFTEVTQGFSGLANHVAGIPRPVIAGGDWDGDGFGDLVIGGDTGTLRFISSSGAFSSNANGPELITGSTRSRPTLGDINGNGRLDLLVLLADGTVRLYLNDGSAMPFAGPGIDNILGTPAPDGVGITVADLNQNGRADVLLSDESGRIWEFLQQTDGSFFLKSRVWGGSFEGFASGLTLAAVDLEGDGDIDLIGGLANGGVIALRDPLAGRPTGLVARPGANSVQLEWDANWQSRIRGYHVYHADSADGPWTRLLEDPVPLPGYLDSPVDAAVLNFYQVTGISYFFLPGNSEPRVVESLPSDPALASAGKVVLSVRPSRGVPGQRIKIRLSIENATGISGEGMQLRVAYDPAKLTPWAQARPGGETVTVTGLSRNLVLGDNGASATGELVIDGTGGSLEPGFGKLLTLQFEVGPGVPVASKLGVAITGATMFDLFGNALEVEIVPLDEPEAGVAFIDGDLDGDGLITRADLDLLRDLTKPQSPAPTPEELMAGDLNGDGMLDVKDFVLLVQMLNAP